MGNRSKTINDIIKELISISGMRKKELFNLKWDDIDFDKGFITIKDPKKGIAVRTIPLDNSCQELFKKIEITKSEYIFPGRIAIKTDYKGVYFREASRLDRKGIEKVYYIVFKKNGRKYEEKVGRQFADNMTPAKANNIRGERVRNKRQSRKEKREAEKAEKKKIIWTIGRLWEFYKEHKTDVKRIDIDQVYYNKHIEPIVGNREPKDLSPFDIDRLRLTVLKDKETGKTRAPATAKRALEILRRLINYGVKRQLCEGLTFKIEMPKVFNEKTEDLTPDQLAQLLKAIDEDSNLMAGNIMKMALYSGMRRGEMFNLQWDDVNFEKGFITIKDPKGGPDQTIPLNDPCRKLLEGIERTSEYVFPGRRAKKRIDIKKPVNRIKKRAGLPKDFRPLHGLRHVYASMLASSGKVDMYTLQKLLTHKSPLMTQRYAHLRDEALRRASDLAGDIIQDAQKSKKKLKIVKE